MPPPDYFEHQQYKPPESERSFVAHLVWDEVRAHIFGGYDSIVCFGHGERIRVHLPPENEILQYVVLFDEGNIGGMRKCVVDVNIPPAGKDSQGHRIYGNDEITGKFTLVFPSDHTSPVDFFLTPVEHTPEEYAEVQRDIKSQQTKMRYTLAIIASLAIAIPTAVQMWEGGKAAKSGPPKIRAPKHIDPPLREELLEASPWKGNDIDAKSQEFTPFALDTSPRSELQPHPVFSHQESSELDLPGNR